MTALDLIREGFDVWAEGHLRETKRTALAISPFLFLAGFLTAAQLRRLAQKSAGTVVPPEFEAKTEPQAFTDLNAARLIELENDLDKTETALKRLTETLSTVYANLPIGLAIFDADKALQIFNPALVDLLRLDPTMLAKRPAFEAFIDLLRDAKSLPESFDTDNLRGRFSNHLGFRESCRYNSEWVLPDGKTMRVTLEPHPMGATVLLFEEITTYVEAEKAHQLEHSTHQSILNSISDAIVVADSRGELGFANEAFDRLFGVESTRNSIADLSQSGLFAEESAGFWVRLQNHTKLNRKPELWSQELKLRDGTNLMARVSSLTDRTTLVTFSSNTGLDADFLSIGQNPPNDSLDPFGFVDLQSTLEQRNLSFDTTGFDLNCIDLNIRTSAKRIIRQLVLVASNNCIEEGSISLSSRTKGLQTTLTCNISEAYKNSANYENMAIGLVKSLTKVNGNGIRWSYNSEVNPYEVTFTRPPTRNFSIIE